MYFIGLRNCKAIIFVKDNCLDIGIVAISLKGRVYRDWEILEG